MGAQTKRKRDDDHDAYEPPKRIEDMLRWLRACGAELDQLYFRSDGVGGICAFAARALSCGDALATVPRKCVLTAQFATASEIGIAALAVAQDLQCVDLCSEEVLLWIFMCVGRLQPSNFFHPYLAALPHVSPQPTSWPEHLREELRHTALFDLVEETRDYLQHIFDNFVRDLPSHIPHLVPTGCFESVDDLYWACGMCMSRAFFCADAPSQHDASFGCWTGVDGKVRGVLLPLLDLLNHRPSQPITWLTASDAVRFRTDQDIKQGAEVFNDYGSKSNEDLLFAHGFCVWPNPFDIVSLFLASDNTETSRIRYAINSQANGGVCRKLLGAIADAWEKHGANHAMRSKDQDVERSEGEVQVVQCLLAMLCRRYAPLCESEAGDLLLLQHPASTSDASDQKRYFIAMYRQGQRKLLRETIDALEACCRVLRNGLGENELQY